MEEGWRELGEILLALRAHDSRIETELSHLLNFYLPAIPILTRTLVGFVDAENEIQYYEHEGPNGEIYDALEKVCRNEATTRKLGLIKLKNRSKKSWKVEEPELMITAKRVNDKVEMRQDSVQRIKKRDGSLGAIDLKKCRKRMHEMINKGTGRKRPPKNRPENPPKKETLGLRLLRLSDAVDHEKAIALNLLERSGLKTNRIERDLNILEESVLEASRHLDSDELEPLLAKHFGMDKLRKTRHRAKATTVASLILMNAAMMQQRIDKTGFIETCYKLADAKSHPKVVRFLYKCWSIILIKDYKAVFKPAIEILDVIEEQSNRLGGLERALHHIAAEAERIAETYADMGMDHAGPLFNRVMGDQSSDGAYFTRPLAALTLAKLALDLCEDVDWTKKEDLKATKIVDLACGSGTLLAACLAEIRRRGRSGGADRTLVSMLHRTAVEYSLKRL